MNHPHSIKGAPTSKIALCHVGVQADLDRPNQMHNAEDVLYDAIDGVVGVWWARRGRPFRESGGCLPGKNLKTKALYPQFCDSGYFETVCC